MEYYATQGERLMDKGFIHDLEDRYLHRDVSPGAAPGQIEVGSDEYCQVYANLCDAVIQLMWPDSYGTTPDDLSSHTSDPARRAANVLMVAAGYRVNA